MKPRKELRGWDAGAAVRENCKAMRAPKGGRTRAYFPSVIFLNIVLIPNMIARMEKHPTKDHSEVRILAGGGGLRLGGLIDLFLTCWAFLTRNSLVEIAVCLTVSLIPMTVS